MTYLITFCSIAILSLLVVSIANQREEKMRSRRIRLHKLKMRVDELESLLVQVSPLLESSDVMVQLCEEIQDMYHAMQSLDPSLSYLSAAIASAEARTHELVGSQLPRPARLMESDARIALAQKHLTEVARTIRHRQAHGKISLEEMQVYLRELSYQHLMVDVISMVGQGHRAAARSNPISAQAFYKKARHLLIQSTHPDPRRLEFIREVAAILDGSSKAINTTLMPESFMNPDRQQEADQLDDLLDRDTV